ncbi:MAG: hypothetical protein AMXMBFR12_06040 [Candidatus Babeliales bacterium]
MLKKLLGLALILNAYSIYAMTPSDPQGKEELDFITAIAQGDMATISMQLAKGKDLNKPFRLQGFENTTPLQLVLRDHIATFDYKSGKPQLKSVMPSSSNKYAIANLFLMRGANKADLENLLQLAVASGNPKTALWILHKGVIDKTGNLLQRAQEFEKNERKAEVKAEWTQVVRRLQEEKERQFKAKFTPTVPAKKRI